MLPMTMTEMMVAAIPIINSQELCGLSKLSSESPAPTKTTAEERGSIPKNVPTKYDLSGTRAEAIKKLVKANGIAGDNLSRKIINVARQTLCLSNA